MNDIKRSEISLPPILTSDLDKAFSKRFKLNKFEEIWNAFLKGAHRLYSMPKSPTQPITHYYTFENKRWISEFWVQYISSDADNEEFLTLNIKLYNDAYLYDEYKNFYQIDDNMYRGWFKLEDDTYIKYFEFLRRFALEYWINEEGIEGESEMTIIYNYDHQAVDIDVYVESVRERVCLSFKPGYPEPDWKKI